MAAEEWIRVEHENELSAAVLVELRPCGFCGKTERFILLRRAGTGTSLNAEGDFQKAGGSWAIAPGLCINQRRPFDPSAAIVSGRLWRRADASHSDASAERVRVRAPKASASLASPLR
jgi:hypothetical protein